MMPSSAKKMLLVSGRAFPALADEVAACLGITPTPTKLFDFASGEIFVRFLDSVRGAATCSHCRADPEDVATFSPLITSTLGSL